MMTLYQPISTISKARFVRTPTLFMLLLATAWLFAEPVPAQDSVPEERSEIGKMLSELRMTLPRLNGGKESLPGPFKALDKSWFPKMRQDGLEQKLAVENYRTEYRRFVDWALLHPAKSDSEWNSYRKLYASAYRALIDLKGFTNVFKDLHSDWGDSLRLDVEQLFQAYSSQLTAERKRDIIDQEIKTLIAELYEGNTAWMLRYSHQGIGNVDVVGPIGADSELAFRIEHLKQKVKDLVDYQNDKDPLADTKEQLADQCEKHILFGMELQCLTDFRKKHSLTESVDQEKHISDEARRRANFLLAATRKHTLKDDPLAK